MVVLTACPTPEDPKGTGGDEPEIKYGSISFAGAGDFTGVSFNLNANTTNYAFYINKTPAELPNINLAGQLSGGTLTPDITTTRDYTQPQTFAYTPENGTARNISISASENQPQPNPQVQI